ncbi:HAD family hydrolase [Christensenella intestinihominis]|uniref:HAD family hydrolase n=1 Tax=Christensenella intestinihominis TaxID=1851429 RepID=UPI000834ED8D|nr:HAD family phosphatase [Christensenella intestinihominis]
MKAILFDFNGTMFFDSDKHDRAWQTFLPKFGRSDVSLEALLEYNPHGRSNESIIRHYLGDGLSAQRLYELSEEKERIYRGLCLADRDSFHFVDGLTDFLDRLKEREIPRNIATASEWSNLDFYIREFHLANWFDVDKITYIDGTVRGKPAPDLYLKAAQNIGVAPGDCIVVEDSPLGAESAKRAGVPEVFAIEKTPGAFGDLTYADHVIPDFYPMLSLF